MTCTGHFPASATVTMVKTGHLTGDLIAMIAAKAGTFQFDLHDMLQ
jgi:uncharacterized membrane protein